MEIFVIGHSNYTFEKLVSMLKEHNINVVIDMRETPYSVYNTQYNKEIFEITIKEAGFIYIYMGHEFGAKRQSRESYTNKVYADFEKVKDEEIFINGIERIKVGIKKGYKIALLGAMQDQIRCHRSILIGRVLDRQGIDVKYILHEGGLGNQEYIEECLLDKYFPNRHQLTLDSLLGNSKSREEMVEEGYKFANRDIGNRTEGIDKKKHYN
ncbi:DUF488 family protein [uncultured Clostridium sp.]|uniref:DUF488 domain-containing protein n=1 Tax=uncultured Clostridium sp. TaxID=59620 RepID=UPI0026189E90|nr:DUF488 domain-containing protein [uncultured Clostridium sp.]